MSQLAYLSFCKLPACMKLLRDIRTWFFAFKIPMLWTLGDISGPMNLWVWSHPARIKTFTVIYTVSEWSCLGAGGFLEAQKAQETLPWIALVVTFMKSLRKAVNKEICVGIVGSSVFLTNLMSVCWLVHNANMTQARSFWKREKHSIEKMPHQLGL